MPRSIFVADHLCYRTKLMPYPQASRFARCLQANGSRFFNVQVVEQPKARGARDHFVTFSPRSVDSRLRMADEQQEKRANTARAQGADYIFCLDTDGSRPFYRVFNPHSGETYELAGGACSCPDFVYRLSKAPWTGVTCKHNVELARRCDSGELVPLSEVWQRFPFMGHPLPEAVDLAAA